jgi:hypothetical protein
VVLAFVHLDDRGRLAGLLEEVLTRPKRVPAEGVKVEYRSPAAVGSWERGSRACRRARLLTGTAAPGVVARLRTRHRLGDRPKVRVRAWNAVLARVPSG